LPILPVKPLGDKVARASAVTPLVESGRVYLPEAAPWLPDFMDEANGFPAASHDDLIDALSQALTYLRRADPIESFKALLRAAAECESDQKWGKKHAAPNPVMVAYEQGCAVYEQFAQELRKLQEGEPPNHGRILPSLSRSGCCGGTAVERRKRRQNQHGKQQYPHPKARCHRPRHQCSGQEPGPDTCHQKSPV
jgi:Terminase RNaseH-like domain